MILEDPIVPFWTWLSENLPDYLLVVLAISILGLFVGYLFASLRYGPIRAVARTLRAIEIGIRELRETSLSRIVTLGWLAFREAIRSKVLVAFVLFVIGLLLAGWFLDVESENPARLYMAFVIQSTNFLALILAMFLSAFSLPNDLKRRTIYTVVTKPVRAWEIVLGRMAGFVAVGAVLTLLMWISSYVFVVQGVNHYHRVDLSTVESNESEATYLGQSTTDRHHRHHFQVHQEGVGTTDLQVAHWHDVRRVGGEGATQYEFGPPRDMLKARVPLFGQLRFLDRSGQPGKGVSVGKIWRYRDYIEGGTDASAIWRFENITPDRFPRNLPLEMTIRVFRTRIGDIDRGILGQIVLANPDNDVQSNPIGFTAQEFSPMAITIPREIEGLKDGVTATLDLYDDLVQDGVVDVKVQCLERHQYFGMAPADLYVRDADSQFWLNFSKGFLSIWVQVVLVVGIGVMFSTFLSGAVAMLATLSTIVTGYFAEFVRLVATGEHEGGGPIESSIRMFKQMNLMSDLDQNLGTTAVQGFDSVLMRLMTWVAYVVPNFGDFSTTHFVADGFSVPGDLLAQHLISTLAYMIVLGGASYFMLRSREIAA